MLPDRVSNPGPLTYESGALPIALRGPAFYLEESNGSSVVLHLFLNIYFSVSLFLFIHQKSIFYVKMIGPHYTT